MLAIAAFSLSLLGTFLVRSGVITSVHAFATDPTRGTWILVYLLLVVGGSLALFAAKAALEDEAFYRFSLEQNAKGKAMIYAALDELAAALAEADEAVIADIWAGRDPDTTVASAAPDCNPNRLIAAATALACTVLGTILAVLVTRTDLPHRRMWTVLLALPLVMPSYVGATALLAAFGPGGLDSRKDNAGPFFLAF